MRTTNLELVNELNHQLEGANAELRALLLAGMDTLKVRRRIKTIEVDISSAIQRATQDNEDDRQRLIDKAAQQGELLAAEITSRVAEALNSFNFSTDHPMPHSNLDAQNDQILRAANHLTLRRAELERVVEAYEVAVAEVKTLQGRITDIESRRMDITNARLKGTSNPQEANEFVALGSDADVLRQMLAETQHLASELVPSKQREAVIRAEAELKRVETQAVFTALTARVRDIEGVLINEVRALRDVGTKLGHRHLSQSYAAGADLRWLISNGALRTA